MSVHSKHSAGKNEKYTKRAKRKKLEDSEDMESSEEELDLTKECHPIGYYINDRTEMINQMFSVIKGNKLKAMLPPILKDCDIDFLKLKCLDQLLGMSEKRISRILDGEVLETSSESDIETNDYDSDEKKTGSCTTSNRSEESTDEEIHNEREKRLKRKGKKKANQLEDEKSGKSQQNDSNPPEQGKTLLEILELEMRARAIRALLKQNEINQDGSGSDVKACDSKENGIKEVSHEVVDLTGCEDDELPEAQGKDHKRETVVDQKICTFEEKIDKSRTERGNQDEEKTKRIKTQLEMQNKLFKKLYRLKHHRVGNEEGEGKQDAYEGPEEGELTSSEEGAQIKGEPETQSKVNISYIEECEELGSETDTESRTHPNEGDLENSTTKNTTEHCNNSESVVEDAACNSQIIKDAEVDKPERLDLINEEVSKVRNQDAEEPETLGAAEEASWRERWLQKDGVQKLVKSSKIYAKVKKRIAEKSQRSKEEGNVSNEVKSDSNPTDKLEVIEGSIKEYEKLVGKAVQTSESVSKETIASVEEPESKLISENNSGNCSGNSCKNNS